MVVALSQTEFTSLQGMCAHSMQWGAWGGVGMAASSVMKSRLERVGMGAIPPAAGLTALGSALGHLNSTGSRYLLATY